MRFLTDTSFLFRVMLCLHRRFCTCALTLFLDFKKKGPICMFSGTLVQSTFVNSRFQSPDSDLHLDINIQIVRIFISGVLFQSNSSFRKKTKQKNKIECSCTLQTSLKKNKQAKSKTKTDQTETANQQWSLVISGLECSIVD